MAEPPVNWGEDPVQTPPEWEPIAGDDRDDRREARTWRLPVPGGWLYRYSEAGFDHCMVFVPRPPG
jgi:hypothetical protein